MTLMWAFVSPNRNMAPIEDLLLSYSRLSDLKDSMFFCQTHGMMKFTQLMIPDGEVGPRPPLQTTAWSLECLHSL